MSEVFVQAALKEWAESMLGKKMRQQFQGHGPSVAVSFEMGAKKNGVWFLLKNGDRTYRAPSSKAWLAYRARKRSPWYLQ